jgi:hypothetical protein
VRSYLPDIDLKPDRPSSLGYCSVVEGDDCVAPPCGFGGRVSTTCFACGDHVCRACSLYTRYLRYGRQRLCFGCVREGCLGTVPRGQTSLLESRLTAQRVHGAALVERAIRSRYARRYGKS